MRFHHIGAVIGTAIVVSACNLKTEEPSDESTEVVTGSAETGDSAAESSAEQAGIFGKLFNDGKAMPLALSHNHPNGTAMRINSIQVKPTETVVNFTATNGHTGEIRLNANSKDTYLLADGRKFYIVPPADNEEIAIASGETMTGDLVFIGAVPETSSLQLFFNERYGDDEHPEISWPSFTFQIPLRATAYSDDGLKKNSA